MPSLLVLFWVIGAQRHFKSGFSVFCPPTPPPISGAPLAGLGYQEAQADPVQWLRLKLWVWEWWWGQPSACYMRVGYTTHPTGWLLYVYDILPIPYYSWKPLIQTSEPSNCSHSNSFLLICWLLYQKLLISEKWVLCSQHVATMARILTQHFRLA